MNTNYNFNSRKNLNVYGQQIYGISALFIYEQFNQVDLTANAVKHNNDAAFEEK